MSVEREPITRRAVGPHSEMLISCLIGEPDERLLAPAEQFELEALWGDLMAAIERAEVRSSVFKRATAGLRRRLSPRTGSYRASWLTRLREGVASYYAGDVRVRIETADGEPRRLTIDLAHQSLWGDLLVFDDRDLLAYATSITLAFEGKQYFGEFSTEEYLEPTTAGATPERITKVYPLHRLIVASLRDYLIPEENS